MIARLWWKDVRQFWPVWAVLVGAAAFGQWWALWYAGQDARKGALVAAALGWAGLYAFAVGSAAFAGEREDRTLAFLDALPVGRATLWGGKVSFAAASTLGLAFVLLLLAWPATDRLPVVEGPARVGLGLGAALVLTEALGWGLFWSSVSGNALGAAVLAMASVFASLTFAGGVSGTPSVFSGRSPERLASALLALAASGVVVIRGDRLWDALTAERSTGPARSTPARSPARGWPAWVTPEAGRLVWQTVRQAWPIWWRLAVVGFVVPVLLKAYWSWINLGAVIGLNGALVLAAGVNVFNAENRGGTRSFLANHGATPGLVWVVKAGVWSAWLALTWGVLALLGLATWGNPRAERLPVFATALAVPFAVSLLSGMVIRRGITAALVAVVGSLAVLVPGGMLTAWGLGSNAAGLLLPLGLLAVSWAWSADWLRDGPGLARWGRLAGSLVVALGVVVGAYVGDRAFGVADVDPPFDAAAVVRRAAVADADNAAPVYKEAGRVLDRLRLNVLSVDRAGNPVLATRRLPDQQERAEVVGLARRGSRLPACRFVDLDRATVDPYSSPGGPELAWVAGLVAEESASNQRKGDLGGAWDDIMVLFRIARQNTGPVPLSAALAGLGVERQGLSRAMEWAHDPGQTPERVRAALDDYKALSPTPSPVLTLAAQQVMTENTLGLPRHDLASVVLPGLREGNTGGGSGADAVHLALLTSPWEVERARRVLRRLFRQSQRQAALEPFARRGVPPTPYGPASRRTPRGLTEEALARDFVPGVGNLLTVNDEQEVARRALVQVLALRHWQLTHDGNLPEQLAELVWSGELDRLPTDPYSNRAFGYTDSTGQAVPPPGSLGQPDLGATDTFRAGRRLLYSVGPDGVDNRAHFGGVNLSAGGDLVFPLPAK